MLTLRARMVVTVPRKKLVSFAHAHLAIPEARVKRMLMTAQARLACSVDSVLIELTHLNVHVRKCLEG